MSGGHYDYLCHNITEFADRMKEDLKDIKEYKFSKKTISNLKKIEKIIRVAGDLAYATEWLMSGDTGEDDFNKEFEKKNIEDFS